MPIRDTVDELTREIRQNLDLAKKLKISYGEETITDNILMALASMRSYNLRIFQTPKNIEAQKGTDWEWFIGSQKYGWVRLAIQAKKFNSSSGRYDSLGHKVGIAPNQELQVEILKRYSTANNAIPLYSFYNNYAHVSENNHWHCNKAFDPELLGWTITSVQNIEDALNNYGSRNFDYIHSKKDSIPVKCLFDCPLFINQFQDLNNMTVELFGKYQQKLSRLPPQFLDGRDIMLFDGFPEELYNLEIQLYPERVAIIELE